MGVSVLGNSNKAALYDDTSGALIGYVYRGSNAKHELTSFVNQWLDGDARNYEESIFNELFVAYKVERGFLDKNDWPNQVETAEKVLGREIRQNSFN